MCEKRGGAGLGREEERTRVGRPGCGSEEGGGGGLFRSSFPAFGTPAVCSLFAAPLHNLSPSPPCIIYSRISFSFPPENRRILWPFD